MATESDCLGAALAQLPSLILLSHTCKMQIIISALETACEDKGDSVMKFLAQGLAGHQREMSRESPPCCGGRPDTKVSREGNLLGKLGGGC